MAGDAIGRDAIDGSGAETGNSRAAGGGAISASWRGSGRFVPVEAEPDGAGNLTGPALVDLTVGVFGNAAGSVPATAALPCEPRGDASGAPGGRPGCSGMLSA